MKSESQLPVGSRMGGGARGEATTLYDWFLLLFAFFPLNMSWHHFNKKILKKENQEHGVHTKFREDSILERGDSTCGR